MGEPSTTERDRIEKLADSFMTIYRAGQRPSIDAYVEQYPELADQLRGLIAALIVLERNAPRRNRFDAPRFECPSNSIAPREIGEFTIVREIGRGGMGVVYEAVQQSLGRHVALKVLSSPGLLNPVHLERFRLEARSAGRLHHSHIVPVFGVGESDGLHYYAMQFIPGQSLGQVIDALRKVRPGHDDKGAALVKDELTESIVGGLLSGRFPADSPADPDGAGAVESPAKPADETRPTAGDTSADRKPTVTGQFSSASSGRPFYESVARVGLQVAEALAYAHGEGILHRDIKPSNLILDAKGNTWVTDFGLVKAEDNQPLTETGDVVGTLRYMAPERLEGWSDRRSDIYGLGATLYELLTLRPFFESANRAELIDDIRHAAPLAPTKIDPATPRDLETIVLKALAKEPGSRYHTAEEMAGDLRRFLADRPILARRSSTSERFVRWCRRNPAVATLTAAVAFTLLAGTTVSTLLAIRATQAESDISVRQAVLEQRIDSVLDEVDAQYRRENWAEAMAAVKRAEQFLAESRRSPALAVRAAKWRTDLDAVARLEEIRLADSSLEERERSAIGDDAYHREFHSLGIDIDMLSDVEAADRIGSRAIRDQLTSALDHWGQLRRRMVIETDFDFRGERPTLNKPSDWWRRPLAIARLADPDEFRCRVRRAVERGDMETLATSAQSPEAVLLRASTLCLVAAELYWEKGARHRKLALELLKRAQTRHPDDFWINLTLSGYSSPNLINWSGASRQRQSTEAMPYCMAAVALRPESFWPRLQLADMLSESGQTEAALAEYNKAIELRPNHAVAHNNLGYYGYYRQQQYDKAIAEYQKAIKLRPDFGLAYNNLGIALAAEKKFAEAAAAFRAAVNCEPNSATSYTNLGSALRYLGQLDDSVKAHLKATILDPKLGAAWNNLGYTYFAQGKVGEAVAAYHRAIELVPENNLAHSNLGAALAAQKHFDEAVSEYHKAIELLPDPGDINTLAWLLSTCAELRIRDPVRALELARVAVEKAPLEGDCHLTLGVAQYRAGKWQDAIASLTKAEELAPEAHLAFKGYFLAMAHWQLGHKEEARKWYGKSVEWMDNNQPTNDELIRFRAEAEHVLGITGPSPTKKDAPQADAAPKPKATN